MTCAIYSKVVYHGKHTKIEMLGGWIHANVSTDINPGTWFVYIGKRLRITISKAQELGIALKIHPAGGIYYLLWRRHGCITW